MSGDELAELKVAIASLRADLHGEIKNLRQALEFTTGHITNASDERRQLKAEVKDLAAEVASIKTEQLTTLAEVRGAVRVGRGLAFIVSVVGGSLTIATAIQLLGG